jgi:NAD(P)-dependent dehydrogenase (short-subunit alcohol dehydrogenase family)
MEGRTVLITGATSGIGKAAAMALAKQGMTVVIHGRDLQKTQRVVQEIISQTGNKKVDYIIADLFSLAETKMLHDAFRQKYNRLDILINNAGGIMGIKRENTPEGFEKTIALNLLSPFLLTQLFLEMITQSNDGRIINVSSNSHQLNAKPDFSDLELKENYNPLRAYGNAKLFLIWNTQHLNSILRQKSIQLVTINSLHPGAVATGFGVGSNLGPILNFLGRLFRPMFKTPDQGASTVVYLAASEKVKGISGKYFVNSKLGKVAQKYFTPDRENQLWDYCHKVVAPYA